MECEKLQVVERDSDSSDIWSVSVDNSYVDGTLQRALLRAFFLLGHREVPLTALVSNKHPSWLPWAGPGVTAEHIEDRGADTRHDILGQLVAVAFIGSLPGRVHPVIQTTLAMHSHLLQ